MGAEDLTLTISAVACARDMSAEMEHGTKAPSEKAITRASASVLEKTCGRKKGQTPRHHEEQPRAHPKM